MIEHSDRIKRNELEAILEEAVERADGEDPVVQSNAFFGAANPEKLVLEWLQSCLREHYEEQSAGKYLRQFGLIPEPYWRITGVFDENVPAEVEQKILKAVWDGEQTEELTWRVSDDLLDGYVDCRHVFQTMDKVSALASFVTWCLCVFVIKLEHRRFSVARSVSTLNPEEPQIVTDNSESIRL